MKNGTVYAAKLKRAYARLRQSVPSRRVPDADDPVRCLAIAILAVHCSNDEADRAINRAMTTFVDWNDVRVSSALELNKATGNAIPHGTERCQRLIDALQAVFDCENRLSLDRLKGMGRREARHYLEQLNGVDEYTVASVILWSLGGHAIPVNDTLLEALRQADLINSSASRAEVQAFMERHVSAADAKEFCIIMRSFRGNKRPASKSSKIKAATKGRSATRSK